MQYESSKKQIDPPEALVGLALSGGGIRSATFNLGLLQGLQGLNALRFGGYDDWRLPNIRELASLIDYGKFNPAVASEFDDCGNGSCTVAGSYWSSTTAESATFLAWRVNFYDGAHLVGGKTFTMRVRAVRGGS